MKDILTVNWGTNPITISGPAVEMRPSQIHLKEDGDINDEPSYNAFYIWTNISQNAKQGSG